MKLPKEGKVRCPRSGQMVDVKLDCYAHCLSCAVNPKYKVCMENMTIKDIDVDIKKTYTKKELEDELNG